VRTENLIRIDLVRGPVNVNRQGRAGIPPLEPRCLAVQVQEPTCSEEAPLRCQSESPQRGVRGHTQFTKSVLICFFSICVSSATALQFLAQTISQA
jgi:hypothetical protein